MKKMKILLTNFDPFCLRRFTYFEVKICFICLNFLFLNCHQEGIAICFEGSDQQRFMTGNKIKIRGNKLNLKFPRMLTKPSIKKEYLVKIIGIHGKWIKKMSNI